MTNKRNHLIGDIVVAVIAVIVVVIAVSVVNLVSRNSSLNPSGRSYKSVALKFIKATFETDGDAIMDLVPQKLIEYYCDERDMTKSEVADEITDGLEDGLADIDDYSCEITDTDDMTGESLRSLKENYEDEFDITIKAAMTTAGSCTESAVREQLPFPK